VHRQLHARLAGTEIHVADEDVVERLHPTARGVHDETVRAPGRPGGQLGGPPAVGVRNRGGRRPAQQNPSGIGGDDPTPHRNRLAALQNDMILKHAVQERIRVLRGAWNRSEEQQGHYHQSPYIHRDERRDIGRAEGEWENDGPET
jgi:hypothetical protein